MSNATKFDDFYSKAISLFGHTYDYTIAKQQWINNTTKVQLRCNVCGNIWYIRPTAHTNRKQGCKKCNSHKPAKMTLEQFISKANNIHGTKFDYTVITEWNGANNKVTFKCNDCNNMITMRAKNHINKQPNSCKHCQNKIYYTSTENKSKSAVDLVNTRQMQYKERFTKKWNYLYSMESPYLGSGSYIKVKCTECNDIFTIREDKALHGKYLCKCKVPLRLTTDDFITKSTLSNGDLYDYSKSIYKGYRRNITITCKMHGDFTTTPEKHINYKTGCPSCNISKGESSIAIKLDNMNVRYVREKRFNDCKYKNTLPFDFYIPNHNICIEYNGEQHYTPIRFNGISKQRALNSFNQQLIKDNIKKKYCIKNGITLIVIPFWEYHQIDKIIEACVKTRLV